eukprot:4120598-Prymnesium_polylepis.1
MHPRLLGGHLREEVEGGDEGRPPGRAQRALEAHKVEGLQRHRTTTPYHHTVPPHTSGGWVGVAWGHARARAACCTLGGM